jgi:hypothetical protein
MPVSIDWARAERVFGSALEALEDHRYPYNRVEPPQVAEKLPPSLSWGGVKHACFLFCSCHHMRGGIKSETAFKILGRLFEDDPHMFSPEAVATDAGRYTPAFITAVLRKAALGYKAEEIGRGWVYNLTKLHRFWNGDPVMLVRGVANYEELCVRIMHGKEPSEDSPHGFFGFREKMVSMLVYFLMHGGFMDPLVFPVPVDFHVLRILVAHEVLVCDISGNGYLKGLQDGAREVTLGYCVKHGVDPLKLCDALWLLSSTLCQWNPGNRTRIIGQRSGRKTRTEPTPVYWDPAQIAGYRRSCGSCPVESTCRWNVPAASYYIQGRIVVRGPREKSPQLFLFP